MPLEPLAWMAEELGYPTLIERCGGALELNDAAHRVLPAPPASLREALDELFEGGVDPALDEALAACRRGERSSLRVEGLPVLLVPHEGGVVVVVARDPNERDQLGRRAAAGEMAAGVAHEVANALSSVIGWCSLAKNDPRAAPPELALDRAAQGAAVARDAARQLMHWGSGRNEGSTERLDVGRVLRDVAALLRPAALEAGVVIDLREDGTTWVEGTRSDLVSIVWNLAQNAIRALARGGHLELFADTVEGAVRIAVVDNGPGMSPEVARKATQRRFTTHPEGFGLGLPMVLRAVEAMGGRLELATAPGQGCRFTIELPMTRRPTPAMGIPTLKPTAMRGRVNAGGQRVLVVEDDAGVRELLATMLEIQGFTVVATEDPEAAATLGLDCDIALIDLHLERGRGDEVLYALRQAGFTGAAAIMSGGEAPPQIAEGGSPDRWLRKPFDPADLMAHLLELRGLTRKKQRLVE